MSRSSLILKLMYKLRGNEWGQCISIAGGCLVLFVLYNVFMRDVDELFLALGRSKFRSRFRLKERDAEYYKEKGLEVILEHGREFITQRLGQAKPINDSKQTPIRNHPFFVAQHATGTCCRRCLEKWHGIKKGVELSEGQIDYIISVIKRWLTEQDVGL